ncbi:MAG: Na+/H+ antiporter NhaA, partial [Coriobacteriales bacterium]
MEKQTRTPEKQTRTPGRSELFIDEVQGHENRYQKLLEFTHSSTRAAGIMLAAAVAALIIANTGAATTFEELIHTPVGFVVGNTAYTMSIAHIINDALMALFFLLVGLEIKYELTVGELTNIRQALLPIIAAVGGVVMPILIYLLFNGGLSESAVGWGIPTATDIAFALGIMALLGNRIPGGLRVFLSTLAVVDDIIAILVIAIFYGEAPDLLFLGLAAAVVVLLMLTNRAHIYSLVPYLLLGVVLWVFVYLSGVHATLAGVILAFTIPSGSRVNLRSFITWSNKKISQAED